ncbi:hypothetical protein CEP51_006160, partial [Fusarium floridanum]
MAQFMDIYSQGTISQRNDTPDLRRSSAKGRRGSSTVDQLQSDSISHGSQGLPVYGKEALAQPRSEGAQRLVQRLTESSLPLWVLIWGGSNVLAEALDMIRKTRPSAEAAQLRSRLRIYAISDQDDTGDWIRTSFPDIFYIVSIHGFGCFDLAAWQGIGLRGAPGYEDAKIDKEWLAENIQIGPLGAAYPTMDWAMEGDTPTFLYLIQNGLGSSERPDVGSWGGRYRAITVGSSVYGDVVDKIIGNDGKSYVNQKAPVYRWRDHCQDEFAARMRWTLTPNFWGASHPPVPAINGMTGTDFVLFKPRKAMSSPLTHLSRMIQTTQLIAPILNSN